MRSGAGGMLGAGVALGALLSGCARPAPEPSRLVPGGHAERGPAALAKYGCGSCHRIPGVEGAIGLVGPPLESWSRRTYIAGEVPNRPETLITWITVPQAIEPGTVMPNLGVLDQEARDMAAYLYTLR